MTEYAITIAAECIALPLDEHTDLATIAQALAHRDLTADFAPFAMSVMALDGLLMLRGNVEAIGIYVPEDQAARYADLVPVLAGWGFHMVHRYSGVAVAPDFAAVICPPLRFAHDIACRALDLVGV
ncbi:hypothetical protein [Microbacterium sp. Leaf203]|uniref:hypothetical protein n=1 Tax=Microbacterium sp. Leaf203 TaxID=1735677 RepID=UPI0006F46F46|nr:hypothetical protein [Microbacterium sp. Leaf203]KQM36828.1 hypothetical protein ASE56_10460 [Microbacterium sp. Leaf203]